MEIVRTEQEIAQLEKWAMDIDTEGSHYDMKCYEEGVLDTLAWLRGETDVAPYEAE